ncbi:MAG: hypothetical protein ACN6O6_19785 [Pseudomonas sp.]|uniref:hypothetical protein n=1 Tax=Pseudomonas sp. TaxID=306 RepID=UPI003D1389D4
MEIITGCFLRVAALGAWPKLEISEAEFSSIVKSRQILTAALSVEEKYDLVLGNFLDLEKELLMLTAEKIIDNRFDYARAYSLIASLNRRFVNFVLSGKSYTELIASKASKCVPGDSEVETKIQALTSKHYDESLDYRLMEALRNHVSHSGLAVHHVDNPDKWIFDENNRAETLVFNTDIYAIKDRLAENTGFKKSVLIELPEKIDLKKAARSYVGAISDIQDAVRNAINKSVDDARSIIESYIERYEDINGGKTFSIGAYSADAQAEGKGPVILFLNWDDVRVGLLEKNQSISNMDKRHVSSALSKG